MPDYGLCGKIVALPGRGDTLASHLLEAAAVLEQSLGWPRARGRSDAGQG